MDEWKDEPGDDGWYWMKPGFYLGSPAECVRITASKYDGRVIEATMVGFESPLSNFVKRKWYRIEEPSDG